MTIQRGSYLIGVFNNQRDAVDAIRALRQAGFNDQQISLLAREWVPEVSDTVQVELQKRSEHGALTGAAVGGGIGAVAGAAAAALIPGVAPVVAGSLLLAALGGGALGAAVGTFAGPFLALGFSETSAHRYAQHLEAGRTVVVIQAGDREEEARSVLQQHGAYDDSMNAD